MDHAVEASPERVPVTFADRMPAARTSNKMNARNTVYRTDPGAMGGRRNQASGF